MSGTAFVRWCNRMLQVGILAGLASCGGATQAFGLAADDNSPAALQRVLQRSGVPARAPRNSSGTPLLVVSGPTVLAAYDLGAQTLRWQIPLKSAVAAHVQIGGDYVAAVEGPQLVAHDLATGSVRWAVPSEGSVLGVAASANVVVMVSRTGTAKQLWRVEARAAKDGRVLWRHSADGQMGAPAVWGNYVFVPFLSQWLNVLALDSGAAAVRLRAADTQISMVRSTSDALFFGSRKSMVRLDSRATSGRLSESSAVMAKLPAQLSRVTWAQDVYSPTEIAYSAADRTRLLWRVPAQGEIPGVAPTALYFRFLFNIKQGDIQWAFSNPRVEFVGAEHTGAAIVAVAGNGELVVVDPTTGGQWQRVALGVSGPLNGVAFDADGWAPAGQAAGADTQAALLAIVADRDARFEPMKELAIAALGRYTGPEVTAQLLQLLADARLAPRIKDVIVEMLVKRQDPTSLPAYTAALQVRTDYLAGVEAAALGPVARAVSMLAGKEVAAEASAAALATLHAHLDDPATPLADLDKVIDAMSAIGKGKQFAALRAHVVAYRADPEMCGNGAWRDAIVRALMQGGAAETELLRSLADDARTHGALREALAQGLRGK